MVELSIDAVDEGSASKDAGARLAAAHPLPNIAHLFDKDEDKDNGDKRMLLCVQVSHLAKHKQTNMCENKKWYNNTICKLKLTILYNPYAFGV